MGITNTIVRGILEKDLQEFRWNADVHTVHRSTGEYRILNNLGVCIGEIVKARGLEFNLVVYDSDFNRRRQNLQISKEVEKIKKVAETVINTRIFKEKNSYKTKEENIFFIPQEKNHTTQRLFTPQNNGTSYKMTYQEQIGNNWYEKEKIVRLVSPGMEYKPSSFSNPFYRRASGF
jgi:hypothetical protein